MVIHAKALPGSVHSRINKCECDKFIYTGRIAPNMKSSRTWTLLDHDKHYIVVVPVLELLTKLKIGKHRGEEIKFQRFYMVIHVSCLEEAR